MILYHDDWERYPDAIIDRTTSNVSFIRLAALYRDMGIKNHAFMLALHHPELVGQDPFDEDPSMERMLLMAKEAKENFWWFLRTCCRVPGQAGVDTQLFRANRGNIALYWLFFNHVMTILVQIRQTGKSFSTAVLMSYLLNIRCVNTQINLITKDDKLRSDSLDRLKKIDEEFPFFLRQRDKKDISNTEEMTVRRLGNSYKSHLPNKSPKVALNMGRGLTSPIFHIDEAAFIFNIEISLPAALAAGTAIRETARENGEPYGTILTTTAGKKDDKDGRYIYRLASEAASWTECFFDVKDEEDLEQTIRKNSPTGAYRVSCTFNHRQLGYTDKWLRQAIEDSVAQGEDADRDYFNRWTSGSQSSPWSPDVAEKIRNSQVPDGRIEISRPYSYTTRWYVTEHELQVLKHQSHLILGLDTSDAVGGDDIGLVVREIQTGAVVAVGHYNETNLITFAEWLTQWFVEFPQLTAIIERRSTGAMLIDYLLLMLPAKSIDPFERLFNQVVQQRDEFPERYAKLKRPLYSRTQDFYVGFKKLFGFATSHVGATSRSELFSTTLLQAARYTGEVVKDPMLIDQLLGLVIRNGRVDHEEGGHDDLVISWLLSGWLLFSGKHLDHYGMNSRCILSQVLRETPASIQSAIEQDEQKHLRQTIESLVSQLHNERDPFITMKLESQMRAVAQKLILQDHEVFSVDDLLKQLRERRRIHQITHPSSSYRF